MIAGILLAAGSGRRFGQAKLLTPLPDGTPIGQAAGRALAAGGLDRCLAVVRPGDDELASLLDGVGLEVIAPAASVRGMGASLAAGVAAAAEADGWVVALGDMPWISAATVAAVAEPLRGGGCLAIPGRNGRGGHPVGFGAALEDELRRLDGDEGGRSVVAAYRHRLTTVVVDDPGIHRDVDAPGDLIGG